MSAQPQIDLTKIDYSPLDRATKLQQLDKSIDKFLVSNSVYFSKKLDFWHRDYLKNYVVFNRDPKLEIKTLFSGKISNHDFVFSVAGYRFGKYADFPISKWVNFPPPLDLLFKKRHIKYTLLTARLCKSLPHIVLDAHKNSSYADSILSNIDQSQKINLEGNFNRFFDLYVPSGCETVALDILSPDFMLRLLDHFAEYDIEIMNTSISIIVPSNDLRSCKLQEILTDADLLLTDIETKEKVFTRESGEYELKMSSKNSYTSESVVFGSEHIGMPDAFRWISFGKIRFRFLSPWAILLIIGFIAFMFILYFSVVHNVSYAY